MVKIQVIVLLIVIVTEILVFSNNNDAKKTYIKVPLWAPTKEVGWTEVGGGSSMTTEQALKRVRCHPKM